MSAATTMLRTMLGNAPLALAHCIEAVNTGYNAPFEKLEATAFGLLAATDDMREGARAFLEKRAPKFTGS